MQQGPPAGLVPGQLVWFDAKPTAEKSLSLLFDTLGMKEESEKNAASSEEFKARHYKKLNERFPNLLKLSQDIGLIGRNGFYAAKPNFLPMLRRYVNGKASLPIYSFVRQLIGATDSLKCEFYLYLR